MLLWQCGALTHAASLQTGEVEGQFPPWSCRHLPGENGTPTYINLQHSIASWWGSKLIPADSRRGSEEMEYHFCHLLPLSVYCCQEGVEVLVHWLTVPGFSPVGGGIGVLPPAFVGIEQEVLSSPAETMGSSNFFVCI
jgi:hypothetical protein